MNKQQITQEVIDLARKIAEHWRMEIYEGCWAILTMNDKLCLIYGVDKWRIYFQETGWGLTGIEKEREVELIPIPDIHDCLEKLIELGATASIHPVKDMHLALLSALCEVLEGEK